MDRSVSWVVAFSAIEAPCPPSPPSGPPRGKKGSWRKEDEPRPPCPARRTTCAESTNARPRRLVALPRDDAAAPAVLAHPLVSNLARDEREQGVVAAQSDPGAGGDPGPALPDEDRAGVHSLPGVDLHTQHLRVGVATVPGGAAAFLVCHLFIWCPASCGQRASASPPLPLPSSRSPPRQ